MDLTIYVLVWTSLFGLWTATKANDEGMLVLARTGGRYDPLQIWYGKPTELWATNQCILDEQESFRNHCIKGNFRSPRIDQLNKYDEHDLEIVVYNRAGDRLLKVKGCKMMSNGTRGMDCKDTAHGDVVGEEFDRMGGFVIRKKESGRIMAVMVDASYYVDRDDPNMVVLIPLKEGPKDFTTGYQGCFLSGAIEAGKQLSVEECAVACIEHQYAYLTVLKNADTCSCSNSLDFTKLTNESECKKLCSKNKLQICGGEGASSVYKMKEYRRFVRLIYASVTETLVKEAYISDSNTTLAVDLDSGQKLTKLTIEEDPDCNLTNIYFNVSSPKYYLSICAERQCTEPKTMTVHAREAAWDLGYVTSRLIVIEPIPHNCTYHRSTFKFFGPQRTSATGKIDLMSINGSHVAIRGKWVNKLPTTSSSATSGLTTSQTAKNEKSTHQGSIKDDLNEKDHVGGSGGKNQESIEAKLMRENLITFEDIKDEMRQPPDSLKDLDFSKIDFDLHGLDMTAEASQGTGFGQGLGSGPGQLVGLDSGSRQGVGLGSGSGQGIGLGSGPGQGMGLGSGSGRGMGLGSGSGQGMGLGSGSGQGMGLGSGSGQGMGLGSGSGQGMGLGSGSGQGMGLGSGPGQGMGLSSGPGQGMGLGSGPGQGIGLGSGSGQGNGPGSMTAINEGDLSQGNPGMFQADEEKGKSGGGSGQDVVTGHITFTHDDLSTPSPHTPTTTLTTKESTASTATTPMTTTVPATTTSFPTEPDLPSNITTPVPAVREACTCLCVEKPRKNQTKVMVAKEKAIKIHKKLKIDTMNLSSSVRRKVSAPDSRITAAVGGYLGICLLIIALGSLILADITSITRHIRVVRIKSSAPPVKRGKLCRDGTGATRSRRE